MLSIAERTCMHAPVNHIKTCPKVVESHNSLLIINVCIPPVVGDPTASLFAKASLQRNASNHQAPGAVHYTKHQLHNRQLAKCYKKGIHLCTTP